PPGHAPPQTPPRSPARVRQPPRPAIVRSALRASLSTKDLRFSGIISVPAGCLARRATACARLATRPEHPLLRESLPRSAFSPCGITHGHPLALRLTASA